MGKFGNYEDELENVMNNSEASTCQGEVEEYNVNENNPMVEYRGGHTIYKKKSSKKIDCYVIDKEKTFYTTNLRLYRDMEAPLKALAAAKNMSVNDFILTTLDEKIRNN